MNLEVAVARVPTLLFSTYFPALALTILIMRPVWTKIYNEAFTPYDQGNITLVQAFGVAEKPIRDFMLKQTHKSSLEQMLKIAKEPLNQKAEDISFSVLLPAFVISELKTAFQIGFMLFIPFLITCIYLVYP